MTLALIVRGARDSSVNPANSANLESKTQSQKAFITTLSSDLAQPQVGTEILPSTSAELTNSDPRSRGLNVQVEANSHTSSTDTGSADPAAGHVSSRNSAGINQTTEGFVVGHGRAPDAAARRFVDAYFRNVDRAYPFVDRAEILENLETMGDFAEKLRDSQSTLLYLIMYIGCTTLERASQIPRETRKHFEVAYAEIIQECVCRNSIESVQILMLLALYSLFDPAWTSTYSIVGIAVRQAITTGLTRRPADDHAHSPAETELRHGLSWSVLALHRMMAVSQGLPVALTDDNADVPLPGLTVDDFASPERATYARKLHSSRHVIQLRQLESRILDQIHFKKKAEIAKLTPSDRRATLSSMRASIEDWYSKGCLMSPIEAGNATVHSSITLLGARYYYLLLLMYYPNHFNSSAGSVSRQHLLQLAQRHLQAISALFQQRQLPLNSVTPHRLMSVTLVLMHDFMATYRQTPWPSPAMLPFLARDEVAVGAFPHLGYHYLHLSPELSFAMLQCGETNGGRPGKCIQVGD